MIENFQRITRDQWNGRAVHTATGDRKLIDMLFTCKQWVKNVLNILIASIAFMLECVRFSFKISDVKCRYFIGFDRVIFWNEK